MAKFRLGKWVVIPLSQLLVVPLIYSLSCLSCTKYPPPQYAHTTTTNLLLSPMPRVSMSEFTDTTDITTYRKLQISGRNVVCNFHCSTCLMFTLKSYAEMLNLFLTDRGLLCKWCSCGHELNLKKDNCFNKKCCKKALYGFVHLL